MLAIHPILKKDSKGIMIIKFPIPANADHGHSSGINHLNLPLRPMRVNGQLKRKKAENILKL